MAALRNQKAYLSTVVHRTKANGGFAPNSNLDTLTQFMNANLISQKWMKANNSLLAKAVKDFEDQKKQLNNVAIPLTTNAAGRNQKYMKLLKLCAHYENLLEMRRKMLEKQSYYLEEALSAPAIKDSGQLGLAIDMQIEAAKDLVKLQREGKLRKELDVLKHRKLNSPAR